MAKTKAPTITQQDVLTDIMWNEYLTGQANKVKEIADFEANLTLIDGRRQERDYDWMSDIRIPEANAILLTQDAQDAAQYFESRDFVDVVLEGFTPEEQLACKGAKKVINKMLNNRRVHHYLKYMQARGLNRHSGYVYALCWWDQKLETKVVGQKSYAVSHYDEANGIMIPGIKTEDVTKDIIHYDHFNWMPIDPRNVFTDNKYTYSVQEEEFIDIASEKTYWQLKQDEDACNYINLDKVKELVPPGETDVSKRTYNKDEKYQKTKKGKGFDVIERYGLMWAKVTERDDNDYPTKADPGYDFEGETLEGAEYIHVRATMVYKGSTKILIRFQPEPYRDGNGIPYVPICRGLCYVHPVKKVGQSSASNLRELQIGVDDTINMSNDRVKVGTFPTFVGSRAEEEDQDQIYMEPEHMILLNNPDQFKELKISSDISGALQQASMFVSSMQKVEAVYPPNLGDSGKAKTTATAFAGANMQGNQRSNYKSLTYENTLLTEFYWIILQMAWQFMKIQTAKEILDQAELMAFKPVGDYTYQPVTSSIEQEYSKNKKIQNYDQNIGRLSGMIKAFPGLIKLIMLMEKEILDLQGAEYRKFEDVLTEIMGAKPVPEDGGKEGGDQPVQPGQPKDMKAEPTSNQHGVQMGQQQKFVRGM
jgi:hypothetical protein